MAKKYGVKIIATNDVHYVNKEEAIAHDVLLCIQTNSDFYNENRIIGENEDIKNARAYLTYATNIVLKKGSELLGIKMPNKM